MGDLKQDMKLRMYLSKGTINILAESILLTMSRRINKLHNKIQMQKDRNLSVSAKIQLNI